jgi:uncharacterized SAM-binding protein YcdF (DUF218 family)
VLERAPEHPQHGSGRAAAAEGEGARRPVVDYVVIFGAGVRADGRPSRVLQHRIAGALQWSCGRTDVTFLATGGKGRHGPPEAEVVRRELIAAGVDARRIIAERNARDTLESVRLCDAILQERGDCRRVIVCTSTYHQLRCAVLLRILGYKVVTPKVPNGWGRLTAARYVVAVLKEIVATPYDASLLAAGRAGSTLLQRSRRLLSSRRRSGTR